MYATTRQYARPKARGNSNPPEQPLTRITACTDADQLFDYQRLSGSCMSGQRTGDFCTAVLHDSLRKIWRVESDFLFNA